MSSGEANVWIAKPQEVDDAQMRSLELTLDSSELERASRFRFELDRRAYTVAHGLRRIALGDFLKVDPARLLLSKQGSGEPLLTWPSERKVFFSHAHSREVVAFAMSSMSPVGIDVECVVRSKPDFSLLTPYLVLPEASQRVAELGSSLANQFFFYWTALEAFWKADGKGLLPENPRIRCEKNDAGTFEITLEESAGDRQSVPRASLSRIQAPRGCVISLAQHYLQGGAGKACAASIIRVAKSSKKDKFFQRTKRYKDGGFITIVSV